MRHMKGTPQKERQAYCQHHGHSWIQGAYSIYRHCSWCEVYEEPVDADAKERVHALFLQKLAQKYPGHPWTVNRDKESTP